jgi:SAM-dependent methyltransferase
MTARHGGRSFVAMILVEDLKRAHRATWASGDYGAIAELIDDDPPRDLLERVPVEPAEEVLDVAAGTGNLALRAAAAGAQVVGLDLTPELFETARRRASEQGLTVDWLEGDAEQLPFEDARFDLVYSIFGVQFAPRHKVAAHEIARVTRRDGRIGLVNWTPESHIGELFKILSRYMPAPPEYASSPPLWGNEEHVRELFEGTGIELEFSRGHNPFSFGSADELVSFFETHYGPTLKAREKLSAEGQWADCRAEIVAMAERRNDATDGGCTLASEYLVVSGRKAA